MVTPENQFMTVADTAKLVGLSEAAIRGMIARGQIEVRKFGSRVLIERAYLENKIRPLAEVSK